MASKLTIPKRMYTFWKYTFQGIGVASFGTIGVSPSIGGFMVGVVGIVAAIVVSYYEEKHGGA